MKLSLKDERGSAVLEFAILAPVLLGALFGALALGIAGHRRAALSEAAQEAARCGALKACASATLGCGAANDVVCFAAKTAQARGVPDIQANQIVVDPKAVVGGIECTAVRIVYPFELAGFALTLSAEGRFPNVP